MRAVLITIPNFESRFPQAVRLLQENGVELFVRNSIASLTEQDRETILNRVPAMLVAAEPCGEELFLQTKGLKILCRMGSGMDNIDLDWCRSHGIMVCNSRGCNANGVAEMTLLLMLASLRGLPRLSRAAEQGDWRGRFPGEELSGKTVGFVGFGLIAQRLAALLRGFGVTLIACDPYWNEAAAQELSVQRMDFEELLTQADIISVHIPALPQNQNLFCEQTFNRMKHGAVFINCSRGSLVDENALYEALSSGQLSAAASDVWAQEPVSPHHRLFELENFIGTPHAAGMTVQSAVADSTTVARSIIACLDGQSVSHRVV